ncbi:SpoIIE family protein phosphatase [Streptomyces sp. NPDC047085]|uniref:SpoIIE family protein phosphatase n=1 Tax=Streptomyces sp. NPDC047085 TaxID=3155140 RepID=UPI0033C7497A
MLAEVVRETGASAGYVYLLPPGGRVLRLTLLCGDTPKLVAPWSRVPLADPVPVADAVRERRLVWVGSHEEMARSYPRSALVLPYSFAAAAAPIITDATVWGGLVLRWPASHPPRMPQWERDAVHFCCHRLGLLLRRAAAAGDPVLPGPEPRVVPPLRPRAPGPVEKTAAADFAERLPGGSCALDQDGRITFITTTAADLLGADVPGLLGARLWTELPWLAEPMVEDHFRAVVFSHEPRSFTALRPPDRWLSFHLYADASGISVRITPAAHIPTALASDVPEVPRPASPGAPGGALGLYHLLHLAAMLSEAAGVQDVVDMVADQLLPAFDAQGLILFVTEAGRLRVIGHRGYDAEVVARFDGTPLDAAPSPTTRALRDGVPSFFSSPEEAEPLYPGISRMSGKAAWAFLPLIASGRPVGCCALSHDRPHRFDQEERAALTATAGLVAQALDRAHLYDAKHDLAHGLQAALLPQALPPVPGLEVAARYLPAAHGVDVGGDFYDLIRLDEATAAAAIGDVQGHNVNAAALMGQVRTAVHATAGAPPGEVLARTNRLLTDLDTGLFTSCLYAHLDLDGHRALLASAGHLPPLLRHPGGHTEALDLPPGLLLGIDPAADYPTTEVALPPGAVLVLFTDGLVEAPGVDLGEAVAGLADRLARAGGRSMDAVAEILVEPARQAASRSDDIALLLIHPCGSGR